jgi:predicted transcriptional regulator
MPCIEGDALTPTGRQLLEALAEPRMDEEIKDIIGQRLFRVRISLRELMFAGLVSVERGRYSLTDVGRAKLEEGKA